MGWDHYDEYEAVLCVRDHQKRKKLMGDIITSYYRNMETKTNLFDKYGLFCRIVFFN